MALKKIGSCLRDTKMMIENKVIGLAILKFVCGRGFISNLTSRFVVRGKKPVFPLIMQKIK